MGKLKIRILLMHCHPVVHNIYLNDWKMTLLGAPGLFSHLSAYTLGFGSGCGLMGHESGSVPRGVGLRFSPSAPPVHAHMCSLS